MTFNLELTGNEARFLFFSIKNKKSDVAVRVREKLIRASDMSRSNSGDGHGNEKSRKAIDVHDQKG